MLRVIDYSEKAIALVGDTFSIKDKIKQIGGTFNKSLHIDNSTVPGWIFPINKKNDVEELVKNNPKSNSSSSSSKQSYNTNDHKASISIDPKITHEMFANLLNKYEMLEARVQYLEDQLGGKQSISSSKKAVTVLPKNNKQTKKTESSDDEEEGEQEIKPKRFLSDI
jgi:hypothetical protein